MSNAQLVLSFVFGDQPTTFDDKTAALAKECGAEVSRIAEATGKPRAPNGNHAQEAISDAFLAHR